MRRYLAAVVSVAALVIGSAGSVAATSSTTPDTTSKALKRQAIASLKADQPVPAASGVVASPVATPPAKTRVGAAATPLPAKASRAAGGRVAASSVTRKDTPGTTVSGTLVLPLGDSIGDSVQVDVASDVYNDINPSTTSIIVIKNSSGTEVRNFGYVDGTIQTIDPSCDITTTSCDYQLFWTVTWDGLDGASTPAPVGDYTITADGLYPATIAVRDLAMVKVNGPTATTYLAPYADGILDSVTVTATGVTYGDIPLSTTGKAELVRDSDSAVIKNWTFGTAGATHATTLTGLPIGEYTLKVTLNFNAVDVVGRFHVSSVTNHAISTSVVASSAVYPAIDGFLDTLPINVVTVMAPHVVLPATGHVRVKRGTVFITDIPLTTSTQTVTWNGRVAGKIVPGKYTLTPVTKGQEGGWVTGPARTVTVASTYVMYAAMATTPSVIYPVVDGFRDNVRIYVNATQSTHRFGRGWIKVVITKGTTVVAGWSFNGTYPRTMVWNGRYRGSVVPGVYTMKVTAKGPEGVARSLVRNITVSPKRLVTKDGVSTKTYNATYALDSCGGTGYYTCENVGDRYIDGTTYSNTVGYYTGAFVGDLSWDAQSLPLPARTWAYRVKIVAETTSASYVLGICYSDASNPDNCPSGDGFRFGTYQSGTWDTGWHSEGASDGWADFYIGSVDWGYIYVARFTVTAKYKYTVLQ